MAKSNNQPGILQDIPESAKGCPITYTDHQYSLFEYADIQKAANEYRNENPWFSVPVPLPMNVPECECGQKGVKYAKHSDYCPLYRLERA